jgi:hypothetical protein
MSTTDSFKVNFTLTVTVTSVKIYSVFTDEVSSASINTPHLQTVQRRHSAAPWHLERRVSVSLQRREAWGVGHDQCQTASLTGQNSVES